MRHMVHIKIMYLGKEIDHQHQQHSPVHFLTQNAKQKQARHV
jgi:hypothetical protein